MPTFTNIKHSEIPKSAAGIIGLAPTFNTTYFVYVVDELNFVNVFEVTSSGAGELIINTSWFDSSLGRFQVYVLDAGGVLQTLTSTLDAGLTVDLILYYRRKGLFYCVSSETFVTGEVPARIHSPVHSIVYN